MKDDRPKHTISLDIEVGTDDWIRYSFILDNVYDLCIMGENLVIKYFGSDPKKQVCEGRSDRGNCSIELRKK